MRLWPHSKKSKNISTKERIKKATFELLAEEGYASISMRDISKRAETAVGQLTYYYRTKESLILDVIDELIEDILEKLNNFVQASENKINSIQHSFSVFIIEDDKICKILLDLIAQSMYNKKIQIRTSDFFEKICEIIGECYINDNNDLNKEEANNKAKLLIDSFIGSIIRKNIEKSKFEDIQEEY